MLDVVEHQQQRQRLQRRGERGYRIARRCQWHPDRGGDRAGHQRRVAQRRELDPGRAVLGEFLAADGQRLRQARLADSPGTGDRDQAVRLQQLRQCRDIVVAAV